MFLISQLGHDGSDVRERADTVADGIVGPVVADRGLVLKRSDRESSPGIVTNQIIRLITEARLVVADVTGRNPNVFYELAVADSFGVPAILLINQVRDLPFDNQGVRTIEIGDNGTNITWKQAVDAQARLAEYVDVVLAPQFHVENVVISAAVTRSLTSLAPADPVAAALAEIKADIAELRAHLKPAVSPIAAGYGEWLRGAWSTEILPSMKPILRAIFSVPILSFAPPDKVIFGCPNEAHAAKCLQHAAEVFRLLVPFVPTLSTIGFSADGKIRVFDPDGLYDGQIIRADS